MGKSSIIDPDSVEYGNLEKVEQRFNLSRSFVYKLMNEGAIKSVLAKSEGSRRGARLFSFASIRAWLESLPGDDRSQLPEMMEGRDKATRRVSRKIKGARA
jgi:hypothetical protein